MPLARALVAGGLTALEVTLRTSAALDSIRAIAAEVPGANVGAGTVTDPAQYRAVEKAGARFVVSPGATPALIAVAADSPVPYLPGVATAGEAMTLFEAGYHTLKFFPAEQAGGVAFLRSLAAPLPAIRFCPTGGVSAANAPAYLALPNVICVGGHLGGARRGACRRRLGDGHESRPGGRRAQRPVTAATGNPLAIAADCRHIDAVRALIPETGKRREAKSSLVLV